MNDTGRATADSAFRAVSVVSDETIATAAVSRLSESELVSLAAWIADRNTHHASYVGYVGVETDQVRAELADMEAGAVVAHAVAGGVRVGLLMAEWDPTSTRVWLHGPWTDDEAVADAMFAALAPHIPEQNTEHEVFCDERNATVVTFARRRGMELAGAFDILRVGRDHSIAEPEHTIVPFEPRHTEAFTRIHRHVHPEAHRTAERIVADGIPLLIALDGDTVLGYASGTVLPDSAIGTIEHVGVDPDLPQDRWAAVYRNLLAASTRRLFTDPAVSHVEIVARVERTPVLNEFGFRLYHAMRAYRTTARE